MMTRQLAEWIWLIGGVAWFVVRFPHQRRARKVKVARSAGGLHDKVLLGFSLTGLCIIPFLYFLLTFILSRPIFADYEFQPAQGWVGLALMIGALVLFHATHAQLGRYWSVTLDTRKKHKLISGGVYSRVRHPMYSAFWLLAFAQAALLANWIAGFAGVVGWGVLYFLRVNREERLMLDTFGDDYREYMGRTRRVIPWVY